MSYELDKLSSQIFGGSEEQAAGSGDEMLKKFQAQIFGEAQEASPEVAQEEQIPVTQETDKPVSGFGASLKEGTRQLVRNQASFDRGVIQANQALAEEEVKRFKAGQQKGAGPLQMLNTPGANQEIGQVISSGKEPVQGLKDLHASQIAELDEMLKRWETDPDYNPPTEGVGKYLHDFTQMIPQVGAQVALSLINPALSMGFMGTQIAGGQMAQLEKEGVEDPVTRLKAGLMNAGFQAPMEQLGINRFAKIFQPNKTFLKVAREVGQKMGEEWLTETLQGIPEHGTSVWAKTEGKGMTGEQRMEVFWDGLAEALKQSAYEGLVAAPLGGAFGAGKAYVDYKTHQGQFEKKPDQQKPGVTQSDDSKPAGGSSASSTGKPGDLAGAVGARTDRQGQTTAGAAVQILERGEDLSRGAVHSQLTKMKLQQEAQAKEKAERDAYAEQVRQQQQAAEAKAQQAEAQVSQEISRQRAVMAEDMEDYTNLQSQRLENDQMKAARMANEQWMQAFEHPQMQPQVVNRLISDLENTKDKTDEQGRVIAKPLGTQFDTKEANFVGGLLRQAHRAVSLQNVDTKKVDEILYDLEAATGVISADPKTQAVTDLLKTQLTELRSALEVTEAANSEAKHKTQQSVQSTIDRFKQRFMPEQPVDMGVEKREKAPISRSEFDAPSGGAGTIITDPNARPNPDAKIEVVPGLRSVDRTAGKHALDQHLVDKIDSASRKEPGPAKPASQSAKAFLEEGTSKSDEEIASERKKQMADRQRVKDVDNLSKTEIVPKSAQESAEVLGKAGSDLVSRMKAYRAKTVKENTAEAKTDKDNRKERIRPWKIYANEESAKRAMRKFGWNDSHKVVPYGDRFRVVPLDDKGDFSASEPMPQDMGKDTPENVAEKNGVTFNGMQTYPEMMKRKDQYTWTDPETKSTFLTDTLEEVPKALQAKRDEFAAAKAKAQAKTETKVAPDEKVLPKQEAGSPDSKVADQAEPAQKTETKLSKKAQEVKDFMAKLAQEEKTKLRKKGAEIAAKEQKSAPAAKPTSPAPAEEAIVQGVSQEAASKTKSPQGTAEEIVAQVQEQAKRAKRVSFARELHQISEKVSQGTFGARDASRLKAILGDDVQIRSKQDLDAAIDAYQAKHKITDKDVTQAKTMTERFKEFQETLPEEARASKGGVKGAKGLQAQMVKNALQKVARAKKALPTVILDTQDQLPEHLQASIGEGQIEAAWDPKTKKIYLVAENIGSAKRAIEVWMHEQVGHHGLMKLFDDHGADFETFLEVAYETVKKSTKAFNQVKAEYAEDLAKMSPEAQKRLIVEEFLARRAEALDPDVRKNFFQRFLTFMNRWLKKLLGETSGDLSLTMRDLDTLLETAKNHLFYGNYREWTEFRHTDKEYKDWCKELWDVNPEAVTWYENHVKLVEEVFGKDAALFNVLLGLTSPQAGVFTNAQWAVDTYLYLQGVADKAGGKYPNNVAKTIERILNGDLTFSDQYKVDEFVRGLTGDWKSTTNDLWMHRALFGAALLTRARIEATYASAGKKRIYDYKVEKGLIDPKVEKKPATSSLKDLDSLFTMPENTSARHKMFQLARELTEETGRVWTPREVQAAIWMKVKAKAEKRNLADFVYDYGWALDNYRSPEPKKNKKGKYPKNTEWKHGGLTPLEYLRANLPAEKIGTLSEKYSLPGQLYEPVSKLEKAYLKYLKDNGVEQIDRYSTDIEDKTLIHYRSTVQKEARGLGLHETAPAYSKNDVRKRQEEHSEKHPYVPYSYWYGPDSKPEPGLISKMPHQSKIGNLRVYNGRYDALGLWEKAHKMVAAAHKKNIPAHVGNVFAQLVKDEGFNGFSINREGQGDWYALFEPQPLTPPIETTIRLSEVVEGIEDMPQEADALSEMAAERGPALRAEIERELKDKYPSVRIKRSQNSIARFGADGTGATSGKMEYGLTLELEGPLNAIRAAMSEIIGLGKSQRMVFVEYDPSLADEASSGTLGERFKFTVKRGLTPAQIQDSIDNAGIRDYNLTSDGRSHFVDMFLGPWVSQEEIAQFKQLYDAISDGGKLDTHDTYSDALGDVEHDGTNWENAHKSYRKHLVNFFGETIGNERFADGHKAGANYEQTVAALGGVARVQGPEGQLQSGTPSRGDRENLPEPPQEQSREDRSRDEDEEVAEEEDLPEEPPEHFSETQKQWYRNGLIDYEGNPRYSRVMAEDEKAMISEETDQVPAPKKTVTAYKLVRVKKASKGKIFPLFVKANDAIRSGEWLLAQIGESIGEKVKSLLGPLAKRPGWHASDSPSSAHIGGKHRGQKKPSYRKDNQVWIEVEMSADVDWQPEANRRAKRDKKGNIIPKTAHITDQIPAGGYYRYKTNPNMVGDWLIGGAIRVKRVLSDEDVAAINKKLGAPPDLPREKPLDLAKYGLSNKAFDDPGPRFSRKVPEDLQGLYKFAGKPKTTRSVIQWTKDQIMRDWKATWESIKTGMFDHLNPIKNLEKGQDLGNLSAYRDLRLASTMPNIFGCMLHDGHLKYDPESHWVTIDQERMDGGLMGALSKLGPEAEYWKYWMLGESVKELIKRRGLGHDSVQHFFGKDDSGHWVNPVTALEEIDRVTKPYRNEKWDEVRKAFAEYNESILDLAIKAGVLNKDDVELWRRETYLPANRLMERWDSGEPATGFPRSLKKHVGGVKELKGGAQHIGDPLENLLSNYAHLLEQSLKNISRLKVYGVLKDTDFFGPGQVTDPNSIAIKVDGVAKYYRVDDPVVYKALVEVNQPWLTKFVRVIGWPKRVVTSGITITPLFRISNLLRDTVATSVISGNFNPFMDTAKNFWAAWKDSAEMTELRAAGGAFSGSFAKADNPLKFAEVIDQAIHQKEVHPLNPKKALQWWEKLGTAAENAARLGLYRNERAAGKSIGDAAFAAKDLMDFSMHGSLPFIRAITGIVPFLNARAQGLYKLGRTAMDPKTRKGFALRGATLAACSVGLTLLNQMIFPDEWDDVPDDERWTYFHGWLPGGIHLRMPMPFEVGAIFGSFPMMMTEFIRKEQPEAWKDMAKFVGFTIKQTFAFDPLALARPYLDVKHNRSDFTGRPIVGRSQEGADPGEQYDPWTSKTLRKLGELMPKHFSPKKADYLLQQYLHGYWGMASAITDHVMIPLISEYPEDPSLTREDYWFTSRFIRNDVPRHIRHEAEFYDMLTEADQAYRSFSLRMGRGDIDGSFKYLKENFAPIQRSKLLGKYGDALSNLRTRERLIYHSNKSADQKRTELDRITRERNELFRRAVEEVKKDES